MKSREAEEEVIAEFAASDRPFPWQREGSVRALTHDWLDLSDV